MTFIVKQDPRLTAKLLGRRIGRARRVEAAGRPVVRFFWARNAIFHGLKLMGLVAGDRVLVPAYHCRSAIDPVLGAGAEVDYYNVRRDGSVDLDDLGRRVRDRTRAVLAIHYFGFPQRIAELRRYCDERRLFLIEDCAHLLAGEADGRELGSVGDISVFSPRKLLPLYDGGALVVNDRRLRAGLPEPAVPVMLQLKSAKHLLEKLLADAGFPATGALRWLLRLPVRAGRTIAGRGGRSELGAVERVAHADAPFDPLSAGLGMTALSRRILERADLGAVIRARRERYRRLESLLAAAGTIEPLFPGLPDGACPMVFPARVPGERDFHRRLREHGLPATAWEGVIHPTLEVEEFPDADFLYHEVFFLPVHQSLRDTDLLRMAGAVKAAVNDARATA